MERQKTSFVIDASVVVKWFIPESDSSIALKLRNAHVDGTIVLFSPDLLAYEVANAFRYRNVLAEKELEKSIDDLFEIDIVMLAPAAESLREMSRIAKHYQLTIYDAAYYEMAEALDCSFITADEKLYNKIIPEIKVPDKVILLQELEVKGKI